MINVLHARVVPRLYVIVGSFGGPLFVLGLMASLRASSFLPAALIPLTGLIGFVLILYRYDVRVDGGTLTYVTLFTGTRSVRLDEIESVAFESGYDSPGQSFQPQVRLLVIPHKRTGQAPMRINVGVFRDQDMVTLCAILGLSESSSS